MTDAGNAKLLGIDLGTTTTVVAELHDETPTIVTWENGATAILSTFDLATEEVGKDHSTHAADLIRESKKFMGLSADLCLDVLENCEYPYTMEGTSFAGSSGVNMRPEEIAAQILKKVADKFPDAQVKAVITVPAYFDDLSRRATKNAAMMAGIEVVELMNEPSAATNAEAHRLPEDCKVITIDMGGGTMDVAAIEKSANALKVVGMSGDPHLGGAQMDRLVADKIVSDKSRKKKGGRSSKPSKEARSRLLSAVKVAKHALSKATTADIRVTDYDVKGDLTVTLTRDSFDKIVRQKLSTVTTHITEAVLDAGWKAKDVDSILLVGGSARIPLLKTLAMNTLPTAGILEGVNVDVAVAKGAAKRIGHLLQRQQSTQPTEITEIAVHTLGIGVVNDGFTPIIPKGTQLPATLDRPFTTSADFQKTMHIAVYRGESAMCCLNACLGVFGLDIMPMPRGEARVVVTFRYSEEGMLTVTAKEISGLSSERQVRMTRDSPGEFHPSEIEMTRRKIAKDQDAAKESTDAAKESTDADSDEE